MVIVVKTAVVKAAAVLTSLLATVAVVVMSYVDIGYQYLEVKPQVYFASQDEKELYEYISKNLTAKNEGIYTNSADKPAEGDLPGGREILSESLGLMMQYALEAESPTLFEKQYLFLEEVFTVGDHIIVWKIDENNNPASTCNALVDDLRICGALVDAYEKWGEKKYLAKALKVAGGIKKYNMKNALPVDFYDYKAKQSGDYLTLLYIDLDAMKKLSAYDGDWEKIYHTARKVLDGGRVNSEGIFFYRRYNVVAGSYEPIKAANMAEQLIIVENLLKDGAYPEKTLGWLRSSYNWYGYIVNNYDVANKTKADNHESPSVYALCRRIFLMAGEPETAEKFRDKMVRYYRVNDPESKFFGGYYFTRTGESFSFDNLQALLTERVKWNKMNR